MPWSNKVFLTALYLNRLLENVLEAAATPRCGKATWQAALGLVETILDLGPSYTSLILLPHTVRLLDWQRKLVTAAMGANGQLGSKGGQRGRGMTVSPLC